MLKCVRVMRVPHYLYLKDHHICIIHNIQTCKGQFYEILWKSLWTDSGQHIIKATLLIEDKSCMNLMIFTFTLAYQEHRVKFLFFSIKYLI